MKLDQFTLKEFIREVSNPTPTPACGSVAAFCGALGAALSKMVAGVTVGKDKYKDVQEVMEKIISDVDRLTDDFLTLTQDDADAYNQVITSFRLPKETEEQNAFRHAAIQDAMKTAVNVPIEILKACSKLIEIAKMAVEHGNPAALTDAGAAIHLARASAAIASDNAKVNLSGIHDKAFVTACKAEIEKNVTTICLLYNETEKIIRERIGY